MEYSYRILNDVDPHSYALLFVLQKRQVARHRVGYWQVVKVYFEHQKELAYRTLEHLEGKV